MSSKKTLSSAERPLSAGAIALMLMLCLSWGFNQIAVKLALPDIPPILQATIRSAGALPVLLLIGWFRGVKFFERDGTLAAGLFAGLLFGFEFVLIFGGSLWAATTIVAKGTRLRFAPPEKALGYQVAVSIPILGLTAWLSGETLTRVPGPLALSLMAYQAIWVVGTTFTLWFALVKTYSASKLSAFTFITPLFGVVASYFIMHDTLNPVFGAAALLVMAGLYLVNRPGPVADDVPLSPGAVQPVAAETKSVRRS